jgi:hypothetical protein
VLDGVLENLRLAVKDVMSAVNICDVIPLSNLDYEVDREV